MPSKLKEGVMQGVFTLCACVSILAVALICIFLFANGVPTLFKIGPLKFLLGTTWKPVNDIFGILPMILGSIYVTAGAILVGVPIGLLTAIYMSKFASPRINKVMLPAVQLLAGIPSVVYGFFGSLIMCDILLYVIAKLGFRVWVRITQLPKHIIFSTVTIFAFVGTYSINQNLFDILCLILFGILGYGMRRFQFPAGPMIIGFILGPLLESAFDQTMTLSAGSFMIFLPHPFSVVLLLLTVAAGFSIARARLRRSKIAQLAQEG